MSKDLEHKFEQVKMAITCAEKRGIDVSDADVEIKKNGALVVRIPHGDETLEMVYNGGVGHFRYRSESVSGTVSELERGTNKLLDLLFECVSENNNLIQARVEGQARPFIKEWCSKDKGIDYLISRLWVNYQSVESGTIIFVDWGDGVEHEYRYEVNLVEVCDEQQGE